MCSPVTGLHIHAHSPLIELLLLPFYSEWLGGMQGARGLSSGRRLREVRKKTRAGTQQH